MAWIHREQPNHECAPPTTGSIPAIGAAGNIGDLWRCDTCRKLWRVADASESNLGHHIIGQTWKPARLRQRIRYRGAPGTIYPDDIWPEDYELPPPVTDPPRQTRNHWLYSVEEGKG